MQPLRAGIHECKGGQLQPSADAPNLLGQGLVYRRIVLDGSHQKKSESYSDTSLLMRTVEAILWKFFKLIFGSSLDMKGKR